MKTGKYKEQRTIWHPAMETRTSLRLLDESGKDLWVGDKHCLDKKEVKQLVKILKHWLDNKSLPDVDKKVNYDRLDDDSDYVGIC